jgi:hypothetical protein
VKRGNSTTHLDPFERVDQTAFAGVGGANNINADGDPLHHARFVRLEEYGAIPGPCQMPGSYLDANRQSGMEVSELCGGRGSNRTMWAFSESGGTRAYVTKIRISMISR